MSKKKDGQSNGHHLWCLYNRANDHQLDALSLSEVRAIGRVLTDEQKQFWFAWREEWSEWKNIGECEELFELTSRVRRVLTPPPSPESTNLKAIKKEMLIRSQEPKSIIPRKSDRVAARYSIEVICNNRSFHSFSQDISLGGIRLEQTIPDWVAGYCTVILADESGSRIEFLATIVENQHLDNRTRLEFQPGESLVVLERWLATKPKLSA